MPSRDRQEYKIDVNKLKKARDILQSKRCTPEEESELFFLSSFIADNDLVKYITLSTSTNQFQTAYHRDFNDLLVDYIDFLQYIFDFYDRANKDLEIKSYQKIVPNTEDVFTMVHDFYKNLDTKWFKLFNNLYRERYSSISLTNNHSYSCWFPSSQLWIANMSSNGTIEDYVNATHEFAHGIASQMIPKVKNYSPQNILIEMFPIVCQTLYLYQNTETIIQGEANKYLSNHLQTMIDNAEEIKTKYIIAQQFNMVANAQNLSRLICKTFGYDLTIEEIETIYATPVAKYICYVFPYLVAIELISLYFEDKDLFKYKVNSILFSDDSPLELLKKLDITPNNTPQNLI